MRDRVKVRRRAGGDMTGRLYQRRRAGGDMALRVQAHGGERDLVGEFLAHTPFYISHRLGGTEFPEFTQAGLDASLRAGFKALEVSVRRCSTGEYVLIHDWKTNRTVPGTDYAIWETPWSTLRTLRQASGPFMTLDQLLDQLPSNVILAVDHKTTSDRPDSNEADLQSELDLYAALAAAFGGHPERRVLWKHFCRAGSARRAKARGYRTMCMLYPGELADADLSQWDVLGMEWSAPQSAWTALTSTGKPTIAHIITNAGQASQALAKGAGGLMASYPSHVHP